MKTVTRWHAHENPRLRDSGDTINLHQARVAASCHSLAAAMGHALYDSDLIYAAKNHDEAERVLGDMPGPVKARFPALAAAFAKVELQVLTEMGLTWTLTRTEDAMLRLCDRLDAYLWAQRCGVTGGEWDAARREIDQMARGLGPAAMAWVEEQCARGLQ